MKSKRKTPYPTCRPKPKTKAKLVRKPAPKAKPSARRKPKARSVTQAKSEIMQEASTPIAVPTEPAPVTPPTSTPAATAPAAKATRNRKPHGDHRTLALYLSKFPAITGHDEYDLRAVDADGEMIVGTNYEYAREALRQALLRLPLRGQVLGAENLAKVIRDEPHLLSLPTDHGDVYYFEQMSYMMVIWKTYAPDEPFPPPFMSFIEKIRPDISRYHRPNPVIAFMLTDDTPVRHKGSEATSDTVVTHIPKNQLRQPSLKEAIKAFVRAAKESRAFAKKGRSRRTSDWLALTYHRYAQGNKDPKPYLRFTEQLRPGEVTLGEAARKLYAGAFDNPIKSPLETTWSSAVGRAEERIVVLADMVMKLVCDWHITPTTVPNHVGRWPVNEQAEPGCS